MTDQNKPVVLHVSSVHYPFDTRIFVKECASLSNAGYEVHLIAQHEKDEEVNGIQVHALPLEAAKSDRLTSIIPALISKVSEFPAGSIVHFHDPELIPVGWLFRLKGYKVVYDIHEHYPADMLTKDWLPGWAQFLFSKLMYLLEWSADRFFNGIVTVVPPVSKRFRHATHVEISNYPLLDERYYNEEGRDHEERQSAAIYIGDMTYRRGIIEMVQAMEILNTDSEGKDPVPLILGGRFSPPEIEEPVKAMEGWEYCDFIGWQTMEDIWKRLHSVSVGLVTLQPVPSHLLLLPVKMFEYMAAGLPVIASDFPMFREIIEKEKCGLLVDPEKPEEIAQAIRWVLDHPEEAAEMGARGKKAVLEKYTWSVEEKELLAFYEALSRA